MNESGFWWILLAIAGYGAIHSLLASFTVKNGFKRAFGAQVYSRYYRMFFSLQAVLLFLVPLAMVSTLPDVLIFRLPQPWATLARIGQAAAIIGLLYAVMLTGAMRFLGFSQALSPESAQSRLPLVERGLYRYVRHPIYTCTLLLIWLSPVQSWNGLALNLGMTAYLLIGAQFEERKLLAEFGEDYAAYRRKTPFLIPGWRPSPKLG